MSRQPVGIHGPTHDPLYGSDPIPNMGGTGIQFDFDNEGGYLDITTNNVDGDGFGLQLIDASGGGMNINSLSGPITVEAMGRMTIFGDNQLSYIKMFETDDSMLLQTEAGDLTVYSEGGDLLLKSGAAVTIQASSGPTTIKPGTGNILVDRLGAGKTFIVLDHLSNPIFTLTG